MQFLSLKQISTLNTLNWAWKQTEQQGDIPLEGRQGHSVNGLRNCLILFGGEKKYNKNMRIRDCFNDCRVFNVSTSKWTLLRLFGEYLESRRNHIACTVGKHLIIIGGVDSNGRYLNDTCAINLETFKTSQVDQIDGYDQGIAFHAGCSVFKNDNKIINLYAPIEKQATKGSRANSIQHEGIYVFGGRRENGDATNKFRVLQFGRKPLKWIEPECLGTPPEARFSHTLNYYKELNVLILIGGKNEVYYSKEGSNIFSDIYLFSLDFLQWIKIDVKGMGGPQRCSHSAAIVDSKLIIFGGICNTGICSSDLLIVELDQRKVHYFQKQHDQRVIDEKQKQENPQHLLHRFSIEGILINENYLFQIPVSIRQQKCYQDNFLNNISNNNTHNNANNNDSSSLNRDNHNMHSIIKKDTNNNSKQKENTKEQESINEIERSKSQNKKSESNFFSGQNNQGLNEFDRSYNNRYEGVKTFLPLPLMPKRNTLHSNFSTTEINTGRKSVFGDFLKKQQTSQEQVTNKNIKFNINTLAKVKRDQLDSERDQSNVDTLNQLEDNQEQQTLSNPSTVQSAISLRNAFNQ